MDTTKIKLLLLRKIGKFFGMNEKVFDSRKEYFLHESYKIESGDEIALVTGGTGALGRAIAIHLASEGKYVLIGGRNKENALDIVNEITDLGGQAEFIHIELSSYKSVQCAFDDILDKHSRLDYLINCAGGGSRDKAMNLRDQAPEMIEKIVSVNLVGTLYCCKYASNIMCKQNSGRIINISSTIGVGGLKKSSEYSAAKSGLIGLTKSLAMELGEHSITVNCVSPGNIQRGKYSPIEAQWQCDSNYMAKVGKHEDVANAVSFLCSQTAGFITGQNLIVDGGRTLGLKN